MKQLFLLLVVGLAILPASQGIPWKGPTHTKIVGTRSYYLGWSPEQTEAPTVPLDVELVRRDITVAPNTCGWVNGDPDGKKQRILCSQFIN